MAGIALVVVILAGVGAYFLLGQDDGIDHPDEWAGEVLPFVEIVEDEPRPRLEHPIQVEFLTDDDSEPR
ncbi:MAG: hypothetical protein U5K30_17400 [Acidimicrobiales bacterium]|nr:hypothetical protein [Acidimicrobiales bacterium]